MIVSINFSDKNYEVQRKYNTQTAYSKGKVDKVIEYSPLDIDEKFREDNSAIFSYERGAGLWLWKPYFILKTLRELEEGDYLFYCDSGAFYINKVQYLVDVLEKSKQSVLGFEQPLLEREFTKKETFELMNYYNYTRNQLLGGYVLLKKDNFSVNFVQEWLNYATDERIISPKRFLFEIEESVDFKVHREDQSIFSILYHKYNLQVFREPTQKGDYPWLYRWLPMHNIFSKAWSYHPRHYDNSNYPRILINCRNGNPQMSYKKEIIKDFLHYLGLYNETIYIRFKVMLWKLKKIFKSNND